MNVPAEAGFDAVADSYDETERANPALAHMRARLQPHLRDSFSPGSRLLEVGSGTGTEAAWLVSERACRVALLDASARLLEKAASKVKATKPEGLLGAHLLAASRVAELVEVYGAAGFDGAYSSLGPLNCEERLAPVASGLAALVRPGGALVLSVMNRVCAVETAWFLLRGDPREASRRWRGRVMATAYPGGPKDVATWYFSRRDIERAFAPHFRVEYVEALPLLWPPTYLGSLVTRFEPLFRALEPIERRLARWPGLRDLGDHVLMRLRRGP